jgi:hypothetical protein
MWQYGKFFKDCRGTVQPDWIYMRVGPLDRPCKRHQPLIVFDFLNFTLKYFERLQSSEPFHAKMNPIPCLFRICIESCLPIRWRTFILMQKIRQCAAIFWFGLRDVGILYSRAVIQRTIDDSLAFLEHGSAKKIAV